ncbi:unnamed protein product [Adineta ricciae]|uniref:Uncharacterized protein n=1 Tax=Adineta ricciae TaxID=249248 RepID=A0A814PFT8_ADIRI|nr:unnamed protein product [Adineta ricciae]CAF1105751.1 unnamed protein product [Adineta ricciae]
MTRNSSVRCIEDLSNEIFYNEIFEYLEDYDIYQSFSNLNLRFQNLLSGLRLRLKINIFDLSKQEKSIEKSNGNLNAIENQVLNDFSFHYYIESLCSIDVKSNDIEEQLLILRTILQICSLKISIKGEFKCLTSLYKSIFQMSSLKYVKISYDQYNPYIPLPFAQKNQSSAIEHLDIDHSCRVLNLMAMLSYTPHLSRLTCRGLVDYDPCLDRMIVAVPKLTYISIRTYLTCFDEFEILMKTIANKVQLLRVNIPIGKGYLNARRWERLITRSMPNLNRFYLQYYEACDEYFRDQNYCPLVRDFRSAFWIDRGWICRLSFIIAGTFSRQMLFRITPLRKMSNELMILNDFSPDTLARELCLSARIVIKENAFDCCPRLVLHDIIPSFSFIQFTHLSLQRDGFHVKDFLKLLSLLTHLESIELKSLLLMRQTNFSPEEENLLNTLPRINKIIRVTILSATELIQVQFLINLCPRVQQLEIHCTDAIDITMLAQLVLTKNCRAIPHLTSLRLWTPNISARRVDRLLKMVASKKESSGYTIKHLVDQVWITWK